jgi:hypothetical protein
LKALKIHNGKEGWLGWGGLDLPNSSPDGTRAVCERYNKMDMTTCWRYVGKVAGEKRMGWTTTYNKM